ncbi:MAG: glycine cleavage system aminomethyltransferase GcvT [Chitinophagales bacterium]|nr:glycine cleavage system aminomethyltransferase GcvT [Chitinophagales bacterium]
MKRTALYDKHIALGAKMVPFAGFDMPVSYSGIKEEHLRVRSDVGVFDVSHMGEFLLTGKDAEACLQWICSNDIAKMKDMQCQYNCFPNFDGGIVDDLIVYKWNDTEYNLVVNASNIDKDFAWIKEQIKAKSFDVELKNLSDELALIAVQGPKALSLLQGLTEINLSAIPYYYFDAGSIAGVEDIVISNTGYTGSGGFEIYVWNKDAPKLWDAIMEAGLSYNVLPCGLAARDTLRLEKGFCLYGNDINDSTSPIEAGLGWITKFSKDFIHAAYHKELMDGALKKKLVGFEMIDKGIPRHDYEVLDADGKSIGLVSSGTQSPSLDKAIGLAYVSLEHSSLGSVIYIANRNKALAAKVVKLPFV